MTYQYKSLKFSFEPPLDSLNVDLLEAVIDQVLILDKHKLTHHDKNSLRHELRTNIDDILAHEGSDYAALYLESITDRLVKVEPIVVE